jgi:hypothetical protein
MPAAALLTRDRAKIASHFCGNRLAHGADANELDEDVATPLGEADGLPG